MNISFLHAPAMARTFCSVLHYSLLTFTSCTKDMLRKKWGFHADIECLQGRPRTARARQRHVWAAWTPRSKEGRGRLEEGYASLARARPPRDVAVREIAQPCIVPGAPPQPPMALRCLTRERLHPAETACARPKNRRVCCFPVWAVESRHRIKFSTAACNNCHSVVALKFFKRAIRILWTSDRRRQKSRQHWRTGVRIIPSRISSKTKLPGVRVLVVAAQVTSGKWWRSRNPIAHRFNQDGCHAYFVELAKISEHLRLSGYWSVFHITNKPSFELLGQFRNEKRGEQKEWGRIPS